MKRPVLHNWIFAADLAWAPLGLVVAAALCHILSVAHSTSSPSADLVAYLLPTWLLWALLYKHQQLDGFRNGWRPAAMVSHASVACSVLIGSLAAISYLFGRHPGPFFLGVFGLMLLFGFSIIRWGAFLWLQRLYRDGEVGCVAILGTGPVARHLAARFDRHPEQFCKVAGYLCAEADVNQPLSQTSLTDSVSADEVTSLLRQRHVSELALVHPSNSLEVQNLARRCREDGIGVSFVPEPYEPYLSRPNLLDLDGLFLLRLEEVTASPFMLGAKRLLDLLAGSVLAVFAMPVVGICCAVLSWRTGRGFRWETRVGRRGEEFSMLRLNVDRDPQNGFAFERVLWQLSISELPQMWNVLRGEMSLIGPRPEGPERARRYSARQKQRLFAKPGMTGLAQVHGLREQNSSEEKTEFDLQYLTRPSLFMDISLLIETIWTLAARLVRDLAPSIATCIPQGTSDEKSSLPRDLPSEVLHGAYRAQSSTD